MGGGGLGVAGGEGGSSGRSEGALYMGLVRGPKMPSDIYADSTAQNSTARYYQHDNKMQTIKSHLSRHVSAMLLSMHRHM